MVGSAQERSGLLGRGRVCSGEVGSARERSGLLGRGHGLLGRGGLLGRCREWSGSATERSGSTRGGVWSALHGGWSLIGVGICSGSGRELLGVWSGSAPEWMSLLWEWLRLLGKRSECPPAVAAVAAGPWAWSVRPQMEPSVRGAALRPGRRTGESDAGGGSRTASGTAANE